MKICIYIDSKGMGGIETHIFQLISGLLENTDYDIDLLFWNNYSHQERSKHPLIIKLQQIDGNTKKRCRYLTANGNLFTLFKYFQQVTTFVHTHGYKAGITARLVGVMTKTPVVSTYHNGDPGVGKLKFYNIMDKLTSFLSLNIAVNNIISEQLSRCTVIPNFVNSVEKNRFYKELEERKQIAFVGRLSFEKGPDIFSELTKHISYPVSVFGDGPMKRSLQTQYAHIDFKGMCDMEQHWKNIRVVVMPSRYEGLPLAALEAMARGIPVIASEAGALPQLIDDCKIGKSIALEQSSIFEDEIDKIMRQGNSEYQIQGEKLIDFISDNFSRKNAIPKIIEQYRLAMT